MEMVEAAEKAGLINMVNLTYRNVAELHKAREMIAAGDDRRGQAHRGELPAALAGAARFRRRRTVAGTWLWRLSKGHGSNGTVGDIGIHILDFTTFAIGQPIVAMNCRLQTFQKVPGDRIGEYVLDANDSFIISAEFANGAIGTIHSSRWASGHSNDQRLRVYGNKGGLELSHGHWGTLLRVCAGEDVATSTWREVKAEPVQTNYQRFVEAVRTGVQADPDFRHAAGCRRCSTWRSSPISTARNTGSSRAVATGTAEAKELPYAHAHPRHRRHGRTSMPSTLPPSTASTLVGGVDVDPSAARRRSTPRTTSRNGFASLDAAIAWGEFDAVANVTPDSIHHPTSIAALQGRQARVLRKAAGDRRDQGVRDGRGRRGVRASSTWST